jgi:excinuclease ABC subunit C
VRTKGTIKSELGEIPGIGRVRQRELLKYFGSVEKIKEASLEALIKGPKMNEVLARKIFALFNKSGV